MTKCIEQDFPCQNQEYDAFDQIALLELSQPISAHELVNESAFCAELPVDDELRIGNITYKLYLKFLRGQTGLYHLWVDYDACDDAVAQKMKATEAEMQRLFKSGKLVGGK